ncbi:hypothetical protein [Streptomyces daliensis]|uniref:Secreted protein n=1 Tax=Streptomyces daliensis TaxID=299421 RepID=A0A8T4IY77_9ACTN|nr:hypothetical protein [Streptomyces daliensis]
MRMRMVIAAAALAAAGVVGGAGAAGATGLAGDDEGARSAQAQGAGPVPEVPAHVTGKAETTPDRATDHVAHTTPVKRPHAENVQNTSRQNFSRPS